MGQTVRIFFVFRLSTQTQSLTANAVSQVKAFWLYNFVLHFLDIPIYNLHIYKMSLPHLVNQESFGK